MALIRATKKELANIKQLKSSTTNEILEPLYLIAAEMGLMYGFGAALATLNGDIDEDIIVKLHRYGRVVKASDKVDEIIASRSANAEKKEFEEILEQYERIMKGL